MIKCSVCGYDNKDEAQFCLNCGSPIVKEKVSHALDDVSEEATVMLDPESMQKRIQDEIQREKQKAEAAPPPAPKPAAPKPMAPPPPPSARTTPTTAAPTAAAPAAAYSTSDAPAEGKDWLVTTLLCLFLGGLGVHRFYVGKIGTGIAQLVTLGGCGIWTLVDLIMILTDKFTDADGNPLVRK